MLSVLKRLTPDLWTGVLTWALVCGSCFYFLQQSKDVTSGHLALMLGLSLFFMGSFLLTTRQKPFSYDVPFRLGLIFLQFCAVVGLYFLVPFSYIAILMVIWSAQILYYLPMRATLVLSLFWSSPVYLVFHFYWGEPHVLLSACLYWMFNLFAIMTVNTALKEEAAKEQAQKLNRELMATQSLLGEASRQAERLRIARNIHDLVGHHLTALTINLQVASRQTEGETQQHIERCHSLARLLLTDVREAVSEIRDKSSIELKDAVKALVDNVPRLQIELDYADNVRVSDVALANTILRSIQEGLTNSLKHSQATHFSIRLWQETERLYLELKDNCPLNAEFVEGNGLKGMRERVEQCGGVVAFAPSHSGWLTQIEFNGVS